MKTWVHYATVLALLGIAAPVVGQDQEALAKSAQNPIASLISLPFENTTSFGATEHDVANTLNIQPVWPVSLNENWNLITRTILPVVYNSAVDGGSSVPGGTDRVTEASGLGDSTFSAFFSPVNSRGVTWGVGPVALLPTSTDRALGAGEWGAGATAVALAMPGKFVVGSLVNNVWSFDGTVNSFLFQPFLTYNIANGWYVNSAPIVTANWKADSGDRWTIPVGGGFGRIMKWGQQPVNLLANAYSNVEAPRDGPEWSLRLQVQFLFPRK